MYRDVKNEETELENSRFSKFKNRLTVHRFDHSAYFSFNNTTYDYDQYLFSRGHWTTRYEYILSCIGYTVGLGNIWRFPSKVYENGGGTFILLYFIFSFCFCLPMVIMEMGLGQFTGMGCTNTFECVPLLFGIGFSQVVLSSIIMTFYAVIISYAYLYLVLSFKSILPWSSCNNTFNSLMCLETSNFTKFNPNQTRYMVSSSEEFFKRYVVGFEKPSGDTYEIYENPGAPQWHLSLCLLTVWMCSVASIIFGLRIRGKIMYFTTLFPYVALFMLFILGCTLPGALQGLKFYFQPNMTKLTEITLYINVFEQSFFSLSTGLGGYITLTSHNNFHDNFYRDAIIIVITDCLTSFLCGLTVFQFIGYLAQITNKSIAKVLSVDYGLYFIIYPEAISTLSYSNMWMILFMLMTITLGLDSHFALLETVLSPISDRYKKLYQKIINRIYGAITISTVSFLCGLLLITPGGMSYFSVIESTISFYGLALISILESLTIGLIYGHKNFCRDIKMMTGFNLHSFYFISMSYINPSFLILLVLSKSFFGKTVNENFNRRVYIWNLFINFCLMLCLLLPILIGALYVALHFKTNYEYSSNLEYVYLLMKPQIYYGPKYKINWLLDDYYKARFIKFRKNREFLSHLGEYEDLKLISQLIKTKQKTISIRKKKIENKNDE